MPRLRGDCGSFPRTIVSDRSMAENLTGDWRSLRPVIDPALCTGCLICWKYCPEACLRLADKVPAIDLSYCKGCGICVEECPPRCMRMEPEEAL